MEAQLNCNIMNEWSYITQTGVWLIQMSKIQEWKILERSLEPLLICLSKTFIGEDPEWRSF